MVPHNMTQWYQIKHYGITVQTWHIIMSAMSAQLYHNAVGLGGLKAPCIRWGPDLPMPRSSF